MQFTVFKISSYGKFVLTLVISFMLSTCLLFVTKHPIALCSMSSTILLTMLPECLFFPIFAVIWLLFFSQIAFPMTFAVLQTAGFMKNSGSYHVLESPDDKTMARLDMKTVKRE